MSDRGAGSVCLKIGVTAHRDLSCVDQALLSRQVRELFSKLQAAFPDLPLLLINSLAAGGDMLVAEIAIDMGIPLEIPVPMPVEVYEREFTSPVVLANFRDLCSQGTVYELPLVPGNSLAAIQDNGHGRDLQYGQLGMYIAGHSQLLLALWDGEMSGGLGGASSVVHFQLHDEMPGLSEPPDAKRLLADKESDLIYHVHCPRVAGVPQRPEGCWMSNTATYTGIELPAAYHAVFSHMQEFSRELIENEENIRESSESLITHPAMKGDPALERIDTLYRGADWLAIRYRKLILRELALTHALAVLMGFCFILYSEYTQFFFLLPGFLLCFSAAWLLNFGANRGQWHRKYLDNRALAEGLRVQFYWTLADVQGTRGTDFSYDNFMQKQKVELAWIRHVMRSASTAGRISSGRVADGLHLAIDYWIGDEASASGQLGYYNVAAFERARLLRRNALLGHLTLGCGISIAVFLLFAGRSLGELQMNILLVLMGMLPLMAAVREAYAYKKADKELTRQYQFMHLTFLRARQKLKSEDDPQFKRRVLRALGEACLEEHAEWILLHRERPLEHAGLHA